MAKNNAGFPAPLDTSFNEGHGGEDAHPRFRKGELTVVGTACALNQTPYSPNRKDGSPSGTGQE